MKIVEVTTDLQGKEFVEFAARLYKGDKNYIRPLDKDVNAVFDEKKNKYFRHGVLKRWLLEDEKGKSIGRIAAFINNKVAKTYDQPTGACGFFECINNQDAANMLFDTAKNWLSEQGMEAMDGPINFGERDRFWGLLIEPFDPPIYLMNYNHPYYQEMWENYGYQVYFKQHTFHRMIDEPLHPTYIKKAEDISKNADYSFRHIEKKKLPEYAEYFREVYNKAWGASFSNFKGMQKAQAMAILKSMKPIIIDDLVWFGFYKGEPVSFFIMLPEVNRIFKHMNGKFGAWEKMKFLYYRYLVPIKHVYGVIFGVIPGHRGKGVEGAMVNACAHVVQPQNKYIDLEMNWIGDFNPKMISIVEKVGGKMYRTYHTYRYLFDRNKEFKRAPVND